MSGGPAVWQRGEQEAAFNEQTFGELLRQLRQRHGLRQTDLVARLPGRFSRSTVANVESGREAPSPRLWDAVQQTFPDDVPTLEQSYVAARRRVATGHEGAVSRRSDRWESEYPLGGPLVIERRDVAAVFRESRAPEEMLQVIDIRARQDGVSSFVMKMWATQQEGFRTTPEVLWGGEVVDAEHVDRDGRTFLMREISFGRALQRGERHTFAVRSWVERMPTPETGIVVSPTHPTGVVAVHLAFLGGQPAAVWAYGPVADDSLSPTSASDPGAIPTEFHGSGRHSVVFERPEPGESYGVEWSWNRPACPDD
jgi:transcriptional regulator with XRE-family HTH domain